MKGVKHLISCRVAGNEVSINWLFTFHQHKFHFVKMKLFLLLINKTKCNLYEIEIMPPPLDIFA